MKFKIYDEAPAGEYFIGDPCYAVPDELWDDILAETGYLGLFESSETMNKPGGGYDGPRCGVFEFRGHFILASNTKYGDGSYMGDDGIEYCVDAGIIGATPIELMDFKKYDRKYMEELGSFVKFDKPVFIQYDDCEGAITIGSGFRDVITILTDPDEELEEYWDDEDDEEEIEW